MSEERPERPERPERWRRLQGLPAPRTTGLIVALWQSHEQVWRLSGREAPITREEVDAVEVLSERLDPPHFSMAEL